MSELFICVPRFKRNRNLTRARAAVTAKSGSLPKCVKIWGPIGPTRSPSCGKLGRSHVHQSIIAEVRNSRDRGGNRQCVPHPCVQEGLST